MKNYNLENYTSPQIKVVDVKVRQVVCASPGTESYEFGTWNN